MSTAWKMRRFEHTPQHCGVDPADDTLRLGLDCRQHRSAMVDTRKWLLSKRAPKKYGDKIQTELTGADGGAIESKVTVQFVNATPPERV